MDAIVIKRGKENMDAKAVTRLLRGTYWAAERDDEVIARSLENSVCFGAFAGERQIGFARVITDFATSYYICDVVVDEGFRRLGAANAMMTAIQVEFSSLRGFLATRDAQGFYERFGFKAEDGRLMGRAPDKIGD